MKRLFIAIPIQDESKKTIFSGILSDESVKRMPVRWTASHNLHLTIQFLGDVDEKRIPDLKQILNRVRQPEFPEALHFFEIGTFPGTGSPRIIFLGFNKSDYLQKIHNQIKNDLNRNGFASDNKPFKPHLTLGRVREDSIVSDIQVAHLKKLALNNTFIDSPLERIILFESLLRPSGPIYTSLYEKKLF